MSAKKDETAALAAGAAAVASAPVASSIREDFEVLKGVFDGPLDRNKIPPALHAMGNIAEEVNRGIDLFTMTAASENPAATTDRDTDTLAASVAAKSDAELVAECEDCLSPKAAAGDASIPGDDKAKNPILQALFIELLKRAFKRFLSI